MSLGTLALHQLETRLPKVIDSSTHGVIDYAQAAFFATMAGVFWRRNRRAAVACATSSAFLLTESLLTDYALGVEPLIPFATHGRLDAGFAAVAFAVPKTFGFQDTGAATLFKVTGVVASLVVGLTDWNSGRSRQRMQAQA